MALNASATVSARISATMLRKKDETHVVLTLIVHRLCLIIMDDAQVCNANITRNVTLCIVVRGYVMRAEAVLLQ